MSAAPALGVDAKRTLRRFPAVLMTLAPAVTAQIGSWDPPSAHGEHPYGCPPAPPTDPLLRFTSVHAALIPTGYYRGKILLWDKSGSITCGQSNGDWDQRWAILDPTTNPPTVLKYNWRIQGAPPVCAGGLAGRQNMFCAGHAWLPDGRLMVAGGDYWAGASCTSAPPHNFHGSPMVCLFTPPAAPLPEGTYVGGAGPWQLQSLASGLTLTFPRWYPTIVVTGSGPDANTIFITVLGGVQFMNLASPPFAPLTGDEAHRSHEVYVYNLTTGVLTKDTRAGQGHPNNPGTFRLFAIPGSPADSLLYYPHAHYVSSLSGWPHGFVWTAGLPVETGRFELFLNPEAWVPPFAPMQQVPPGPPVSAFMWLEESTALLFPNLTPSLRDVIVTFGGMKTDNQHQGAYVTDEVYMLDTKLATPAWTKLHPMHHARKFPNCVNLPSGGILVLGGSADATHSGGTGIREPELYQDGNWTLGPPEATDRTYHSQHLLTEAGDVVSCGGDSCEPGKEYQIFRPTYGGGTRPQIVSLPQTNLVYGQPFTADVTLAVGQTLRMVLMAPGSVTHGHDPNQRYFQLPTSFNEVIETEPRTVRATVQAPAGRTDVPPGHYMLFAVTGMGAPSVAKWVKL